MSRGPHDEEITSITTAREPYSRKIASKERQYVISMAIRSMSFVAFVLIDHPIRWVFAAAAIFLPYVAVVIGNAVIRSEGDGPSPFGATAGQLDAGSDKKLN